MKKLSWLLLLLLSGFIGKQVYAAGSPSIFDEKDTLIIHFNSKIITFYNPTITTSGQKLFEKNATIFTLNTSLLKSGNGLVPVNNLTSQPLNSINTFELFENKFIELLYTTEYHSHKINKYYPEIIRNYIMKA